MSITPEEFSAIIAKHGMTAEELADRDAVERARGENWNDIDNLGIDKATILAMIEKAYNFKKNVPERGTDSPLKREN